jgi:hypothetical protein
MEHDMKWIESAEPQNNCELEDVLNKMVDIFQAVNLAEDRLILLVEIRKRRKKWKKDG